MKKIPLDRSQSLSRYVIKNKNKMGTALPSWKGITCCYQDLQSSLSRLETSPVPSRMTLMMEPGKQLRQAAATVRQVPASA